MKSKLRICAADDERDMRDYLQKILPRLGHEVVSVAETGHQLVQDCNQYRPDLVITDDRMPDMNGLEAAEELNRESPTPVVLVTGHHDAPTAAKLKSANVVACLEKPIKLADLESVIEHVTNPVDSGDTLTDQGDSRTVMLKQSLAQLHDELAQTDPIDTDVRSMLVQVLHDIEGVLHEPQKQSSEHSPMIQRLQDAVQHFEDAHPRIVTLVGQIADGLSRIGI